MVFPDARDLDRITYCGWSRSNFRSDIGDSLSIREQRKHESPMTFYITFGQKYRYEPHPHGGHPDGWFEVEAESAGEARNKVFLLLKNQWSFMYSEDEFEPKHFPKGKMGEI